MAARWPRLTCRSAWHGRRGSSFWANSWVERQYLHKAEKSGRSDSIRFGNEFGYRFESCAMCGSAQLRINVGANERANPWKSVRVQGRQGVCSACS